MPTCVSEEWLSQTGFAHTSWCGNIWDFGKEKCGSKMSTPKWLSLSELYSQTGIIWMTNKERVDDEALWCQTQRPFWVLIFALLMSRGELCFLCKCCWVKLLKHIMYVWIRCSWVQWQRVRNWFQMTSRRQKRGGGTKSCREYKEGALPRSQVLVDQKSSKQTHGTRLPWSHCTPSF